MKIIAVIGAGTMGNGIAHTFAQSGFTVKLIDVSEKALDKGMATIFANLDRMVSKGSISEEDKFKTLNNIRHSNITKRQDLTPACNQLLPLLSGKTHARGRRPYRYALTIAATIYPCESRAFAARMRAFIFSRPSGSL